MMRSQVEGKGAKVATTIVIWVVAAGMLAICIPLVSITNSGVILPVAIVLGVSASTISIWWSNNLQTRQMKYTIDRLAVLEQRTTDLETIYGKKNLDIVSKM